MDAAGLVVATPRARRRAAWLRATLLALWALVAFVLPFFARELSFTVFGWPFSYWLAAQGALLMFIGIVVAYALAMRRLIPDLPDDGGTSD